MGAEALESAVFNWAQKRGVDTESLGIKPNDHEEDEGRIVCKCFNLSEPDLKRKITELNLRTIPEITSAVKAGGACMSCHHAPGGLQDLLDDAWGKQGDSSSQPAVLMPRETTSREEAELSPYQFAKKVEKVVAEHVRPVLLRDGGDVEIIDIKEKLIYCQLAGACHGCAGASMTLKLMIEKNPKYNISNL